MCRPNYRITTSQFSSGMGVSLLPFRHVEWHDSIPVKFEKEIVMRLNINNCHHSFLTERFTHGARVKKKRISSLYHRFLLGWRWTSGFHVRLFVRDFTIDLFPLYTVIFLYVREIISYVDVFGVWNYVVPSQIGCEFLWFFCGFNKTKLINPMSHNYFILIHE